MRYPCSWVVAILLMLLAAAIGLHFSDATDPFYRIAFVALVGTVGLLDLLDGYLARRWGHVSRFGTALDFLTDQAAHTAIWLVSAAPAAIPLMILEWLTGVAILRCTLREDAHWKEVLLARGGALIRAYFSRHQRNVLSALSALSHFALPASFYLGLPHWSIWIWLPGVLLYAWMTLCMLWALSRFKSEDCCTGIAFTRPHLKTGPKHDRGDDGTDDRRV